MANAFPQTYAGEPAPGVDPTVDELNQINSTALAGDWLGANPVLLRILPNALAAADSIYLRDLAGICHEEYADILASIQRPVVPTAFQQQHRRHGQHQQPAPESPPRSQ